MANSKPLVLIVSTIVEDPSNGMPEDAQEKLKEYFDITTLKQLEKNDEMLTKVRALGLCDPWKMPELVEWIPKLPNLQCISVNGVGYDAYYNLYKPFGIPLGNTPQAVTSSVADLAMALMLNVAHDVMFGVQLAMRENPPKSAPRAHVIPGVCGKTLGIVGFGKIGYAIARRAHAFDMKILYNQRSQRSGEEENQVGASYHSDLDTMLPKCDYVMIVCPLTPQTEFLFNSKRLHLMKKTACLINVGRGKIVDQEALVEALSTGVIRQAALDVTYPEPLPAGHALLSMPNVLLTPHVPGLISTARRQLIEGHLRNLKAVLLEGKPMPFEIKPKN